VSLRIDGSPNSTDSAIRNYNKLILCQEVFRLRRENQWLRQQVAETNARIDQLEANPKQYENAYIPSNKKGDAGRGGSRSESGDDKIDNK
jgi:hypothetical protein